MTDRAPSEANGTASPQAESAGTGSRGATWHEAALLFEALLDAPEFERQRQLTECSPEVRAEVERLLNADQEAGDFLEQPYSPAGESGDSKRESSYGGLVVGSYRVLEEIGRGGMGAVFRAERADGQFEQRVALKLLKHEIWAPELRQRFLAERNILAGLEHPGIARLVDGGLTEDGMPYFAMELVDGEPIDRYCDSGRLGVEERIALFLQACDAVAHAHQHLVVHRDLKPGHILVDGEGRVKLLDFGIAKVLEQDSRATRTGLIFLTPEFAAPEQIEGGRITTATDVYALGLVLFELLTGESAGVPGRSGSVHPLRSDPRELPRSSSVVLRGDPGTAKRRSSTPAVLSRCLRGDLDAIVAKAVRKEGSERYLSARELGDDLRRYLAHRPVTARHGSRWYTLRKSLRRHRTAAAAGLGAALLLIGGLLSTSWQARRAAREASRARAAEQEARAISSFLVDEMLSAASPEVALGRDLTVREVLEAASSRIEQSFAGQPRLEAAVRATVGETWKRLGDLDAASRHLGRAQQLVLGGGRSEDGGIEGGGIDEGASEPELAMRLTASLGELDVLHGSVGEGIDVLEMVLERQRAVLGGAALDGLRTELLLGDALRLAGRWEEAEAHLRHVVAELEAHHPEAWRDRVRAMSRLGTVLGEQRERVEALELLEQTLRLQERYLAPDSPEIATTRRELAAALHLHQRETEAEAQYRAALATHDRVLGRDHATTLETLNGLGVTLWRLERRAEALGIMEDVLARRREVLGEEHPDTLAALGNVAVMTAALRSDREAEPLYREVLAARVKSLGELNPSTVRALRNLIELVQRSGDEAELRRLVSWRLEIGRRQVQGEDVSPTLLSDVAEDFLLMGPSDLRDPGYALELAREAVNRSGGELPDALHILALAQAATGERDAAIATLRRAAAAPGGEVITIIERDLIDLLEEGDGTEAARDFVSEHLERRRQRLDPENPAIASSHFELGRLAARSGQLPEARNQFELAREQLLRTYPEDHYRVVEVEVESALAEGRLGDRVRAERRLREITRELDGVSWGGLAEVRERALDALAELSG